MLKGLLLFVFTLLLADVLVRLVLWAFGTSVEEQFPAYTKLKKWIQSNG